MSANTLAFVVQTDFETTTCCNCGVVFCMPVALIEQRRINGKDFYCPNGHSMVFKGGMVEVLRKQLAEAEEKLRWATAQSKTAEKKIKQLKKRVANGVCPCCKRSFQNLSRHMHTKHPDFQAEVTT